MVAWINFSILVFTSIIYLFLYVRSASPAGREKIIGPRAYRLCFHDRLAAGALELVITANYVLYFFFPLESPMPLRFPWAWWLSILIAILIGVPACILMVIGIRDAGEEAMLPKKEHTMYGGIYTKLRHPQAVGEVFLFPVIALALNSPFLTIFSLIYFPIFMIMCHAEEQDLLLRYGKVYADYCQRTGAFWPKRSS
jgi:protein-S-isoprenylcysteine O-methyltransferase Ste14